MPRPSAAQRWIMLINARAATKAVSEIEEAVGLVCAGMTPGSEPVDAVDDRGFGPVAGRGYAHIVSRLRARKLSHFRLLRSEVEVRGARMSSLEYS